MCHLVESLFACSGRGVEEQGSGRGKDGRKEEEGENIKEEKEVTRQAHSIHHLGEKWLL